MPVNEYKLRLDAERGARAKALIDNDILKEAFAALKASYLEQWQDTKHLEVDARERLWMAHRIVGKVRAHLDKLLADGSLAEKELVKFAADEERGKLFKMRR